MNELLLLSEAVVCAALVVSTWAFARERLYGVITILLMLIMISGGKLVELFGHTTNTGNIFYASIFLATYFLIERLGKREGVYSVWMGVIGVAFFFVLIQITISLVSSPASRSFSSALEAAFAPSSRIGAASLISYIFSQNLNVYIYIYLKERWNGASLWLRANIANACAQLLDSAVFFTIAFWGMVAPENIADIIATGFAIKIIFIAIFSGALYLNKIEQEDGRDFSRISIR